MRKVVVFTNLSLDGVMQAPAKADEDPRGGFQYGGWAAPYEAMSSAGGDNMSNAGPFLFGRRTYENFYAVWANRTDNPYSEIFDNTQKYVASTTLKEPLVWTNSTLLKGNVAEAVAELKAQPGKDFLVMGSGVLVQTLMKHNLVDLYILLIHPLILGSGRRLFPDGSPYTALQLVDVKTTPTNVIIATYQPGIGS
jgi:dihydrofolate reductase